MQVVTSGFGPNIDGVVPAHGTIRIADKEVAVRDR
jgi:hypothetical protein